VSALVILREPEYVDTVVALYIESEQDEYLPREVGVVRAVEGPGTTMGVLKEGAVTGIGADDCVLVMESG
jgi:hypothetical protein